MVEEQGYDTQILTDAAIDFLRNRDSRKPFFLFVGYATTHNPWINREDRLVSRYRHATFRDIPDDMPYAYGEVGTHPKTPDDPKEALAQYYASATMIDDAVGQLLGELKAQGDRDESLVVYTSDHGLNMGHHGIWGKGNGSEPLNMLEESIRVPLILNHPGLIEGGQVRSELVNHCDLFMSLLNFADARPRALDQIPGTSYRHLLDGREDPEWDNTTIVEYGNVQAIRDERYKLVQRHDGYENLLHDLQQDPRETVNLFRDPQYQNTVKRFTKALYRFFAQYEVAEHSGTRGDDLPNSKPK